MIFANWRGFSGAMRGTYDQVLKFGAYIVDALRAYEQPVIVHIPPYQELRDRALAVLDATINPSHMDMYADPESRGGCWSLEEQFYRRFRTKDLIKTMHRMDARCIDLLQRVASNPGGTGEQPSVGQRSNPDTMASGKPESQGSREFSHLE